MIPPDIQKTVIALLCETLHYPVQILNTVAETGGSINQAAKLETNAGLFFIKWNRADKYPAMFEAEVRGLKLLADANAFQLPEVIATGTAGETAFLLLRYLSKETATAEMWYKAGNALAALHKNTAPLFGLDHDNYIGSLPQQNTVHKTWAAFYTEQRIIPQIKMAFDNQKINKTLVKQAEHFCSRLEDLFPEEKPALLHGDLWSGNFMHSTTGPAVFDPAVYFGHREMDLAMTRLFGGFNADFYAGYEAEFATDKKASQRVDYCNLYPLLVHVNLFGASYIDDAQRILKQFA